MKFLSFSIVFASFSFPAALPPLAESLRRIYRSISIAERNNPRPGPGPRPQPNAGRACFYEDADLRGASFCMTRNQRSVSALAQNWNDRISSVSVPRGMTVVLYSDWRFGGQTQVLRAGNHTLYNFNDVTSSIQVY